MNYTHILLIESFISGFLFQKPGAKFHSIEILGGNDSGKAKLNFYKALGEAQTKVFFSETISFR
jgi:hypothetical protein